MTLKMILQILKMNFLIKNHYLQGNLSLLQVVGVRVLLEEKKSILKFN
jgi:hypothetical protein